MKTFLPRDAQNRLQPIYAVCSSHRLVIKAALEMAASNGDIALIEATCNQVNQFGGYSGMQAADFHDFVKAIAAEIPAARFSLGGDHLGPNPWRDLPAAEAMKRAEEMVASYVAAGFHKIHLDASMPCADDPEILSDATIAERAARLCVAAEAAALADYLPIYVIGTEVPKPGGVVGSVDDVHATTAEAAEAALTSHKKAWQVAGLSSSWSRVVALVVQPGVEFSDDAVSFYDSKNAKPLSHWLATSHEDIVFEAHSTDYQPGRALTALVQDDFRILKVGPGLTFALREVLYALDAIALVLLPKSTRKRLPCVLEEVMLQKPVHWIGYYGETPSAPVKRHFSYSDRIRYYWTEPEAIQAVEALCNELTEMEIPETLVSQYLPDVYPQLPRGMKISVDLLIDLKLHGVLSLYASACKVGKVN